jgi:hypothetical protein
VQDAGHGPVFAGIAVVLLLMKRPMEGGAIRSASQYRSAFLLLVPMGPLADGLFARPHDARVTYVQLPQRYRRADDADSVRLEFKLGATPGLQVLEPYPDWRGHDVLVLDVTNPTAKAASFMLRILDATHDWSHADRFNQPVVIPGAARTTIRISLEAVATSPAGRRMDLGAIANVMLFALQPLDTGEFYVTRVWLE